MDEQRMRETRERVEATPAGYWHPVLGSGHNAMTAIATEDNQGQITFIADLYPDYIVEMPQSERVWQNRTALLAFLTHARADTLALLDALAAREAEVAELKDAIERVDRDANKRGEHTRQGAPSQAHSFTRGMKYAISVIRDYDDPRIDFPALAEPPPGDGAGGGEA